MGRSSIVQPGCTKRAPCHQDEFKREVERELTGRESEPWGIIYFKLYKTQIPVVEQAIETAALMLGTDKARGYCLEMICADFLAGANLENGDPTVLLQVSALRTEEYFREGGRRANRAATLRILARAGKGNPPSGRRRTSTGVAEEARPESGEWERFGQ
jgi:hypothetical protein